ncbi:monooxygenase [Amycolatopsis sp. AA4]|uniref:FAD-dependent monooxygenase n=1 Tax=Actinomycetes TaxID=1760 RepID=UPI0001B58BF7|nr:MULTISPECIES: FAD-dependent monooxygenase [Actinomycetes]ATY14866.1 monooxygenase [Amycolatopsis sp. AA4]EFL11030.1 oxidoreductase [Streptomyces sp. AA4]
MALSRVLIHGAGIAGPALAYWLARHGYRPTVVEQAKELRSGGSAVVVKEPALTVARSMGVLTQLREVATSSSALSLLDPDGRQLLRVPTASPQAVEVTRSDLSAVLHRAARDDAEFLFDDTITDLQQDRSGVDVTFRRSPPRRFDLLIGTDGIHSPVRRLVFGPAEQFTTGMGMYSATVPIAPGALDDPSVAVMLTAPGRMLALHPSRGKPLAMFTFRGGPVPGYDRHDTALHKRMVTEAYAGIGWRGPELVEAYQNHPAPFFDPLANVRMDKWSHGRVALLGDAASAVALLGDGSSMAMTGAHTLAEALAEHPGDHARAFQAYEAKHRRQVDPRHRRVNLVGRLLVPRTPHGLALRNTVGRAVGFVTRTRNTLPAKQNSRT